MVLRRLRGTVERGTLISAAAAILAALIAYAAMRKLGAVGLLAPLALVLLAVILVRPLLAVGLVVALAVLCEGPTFGIFTFTDHIYTQLYRDISLLDALVLLAVASVAIDVMRSGRGLRCPRALVLPLVLLALAMVAGIVTGHAGGASLRFAITSEHVLLYLLLLPVAVANLDLDRRRLRILLGAVAVIVIFKALLGLVEVVGHLGAQIEGSSTLTYYEPTTNWAIMVVLLSVAAAALARTKMPLWTALGSPLLLACLLLSYRRSFWVGAALGVLLVLLLGISPLGRRLLLPAALAVAAGVLLLGSLNFQSQLPIVKRVTSLAPNRLEANLQDRYRLDERANVISAISQHPITGLGMTIPWRATARPLPLEGEGEGRQYVHFAALWFWMKLGVLGLFAYIAVMLGGMALALETWRKAPDGLMRAFGLGSLCSIAGLLVIDTTASFTGVDPRFTILFGAQLGLLALIARAAHPPAREA
jgi:O-antigen ligase